MLKFDDSSFSPLLKLDPLPLLFPRELERSLFQAAAVSLCSIESLFSLCSSLSLKVPSLIEDDYPTRVDGEPLPAAAPFTLT